jgi:hypothetical protein
MIPEAVIEFRAAAAPVREVITKFGGQPTWIEEPTWPVSRETGNPMRFIGQVALDPRIFGPMPARMAYLFMTDEEEFVDRYEPDGGENAVIVQPGEFGGPARLLAEGPTLYRMVEKPGADRLVPEPCEFLVTLAYGEDAERRTAEEEAEEGQDGYENKIGGTPTFLQGEEFPQGGPWRLLLQLDSASVPFSINFGDAGVGYAFVAEEGTVGKFLWQCC